MLIESKGKLPTFELPVISGDRNTPLNLKNFLSPDKEEKRSLITRLSDLAVETLEQKTALRIIRFYKKDNGDFKFTEDYTKTKLFNQLTDFLIDYYSPSLDKQLKLAEALQEVPMTDARLHPMARQMMAKQKFLLGALDQMFFQPKKKTDQLSYDLRRLFIHASNQAQAEVLMTEKAYSKDNLHEAISRFEKLTGLTPHYNLDSASSYEDPLLAYMPVLTKEIDWQHDYLKAVKELFGLSNEKAQSIVKYLGLLNAHDLPVEGFARTHSAKPYVNLAPAIVDQVIVDTLKDPEIDLIPMSTVIHEITHGLLKERYSEFFNPRIDDKLVQPLENIKVVAPSADPDKMFDVRKLEELICFALTIYVNPVTSTVKLASIDINDKDSGVNDSYEAAAMMGKRLMEKYKILNPANNTPLVLEEIKQEALAIAKHNIQSLDELKAQLVSS